MSTAPRMRPSRSGLARPPDTLSWSTSVWNCWSRGESGWLVGISVVVMALLVTSGVGRVGRSAEVGGSELVGDLVRRAGTHDPSVQHDGRDRRDPEDRLGE